MRVIKKSSSNPTIALVLLSLLLFGTSVLEILAQGKSARLFDSCGVITDTSEAEMARLDNFDVAFGDVDNLTTTSCERTTELEKAAEDLKALGEGRLPEKKEAPRIPSPSNKALQLTAR